MAEILLKNHIFGKTFLQFLVKIAENRAGFWSISRPPSIYCSWCFKTSYYQVLVYKLRIIIGQFPLLLWPLQQRLKLNVLNFGSRKWAKMGHGSISKKAILKDKAYQSWCYMIGSYSRNYCKHVGNAVTMV